MLLADNNNILIMDWVEEVTRSLMSFVYFAPNLFLRASCASRTSTRRRTNANLSRIKEWHHHLY
jgi:hypothetical protein